MIKFYKSKEKERMFQSHFKGVTQEIIDQLKTIEVGDKLVIFVNDDGTLMLRKSIYKGFKEELPVEENLGA